MSSKISVVINTLNEAENLKKVLNSVQWADEILVCDMFSDDDIEKVAKKPNVKLIRHERLNYVEPARNFAISKASGDWVLILDPDEEIPNDLVEKLKDIMEKEEAEFVEIPRKNYIFNKWMKASMWWPDYNIRFFKKGVVEWTDEIHRPPKTKGHGIKLAPDENLAIIHHHYNSLSEFIERMNRYSSIQANQLIESGYKFKWQDIISKPLGEFLGRYFANRGFNDGLHGLVLSLLQAFSFLVMYLKVWEQEKFEQKEISLKDMKELSKKSGEEINYWFKYSNLSDKRVVRFIQKVKNRLS